MPDSPFESPQRPISKEGSVDIKDVMESVRRHEGNLQVQGERIAALIAKEPSLATRDWVFVTFIKYAIPIIAVMVSAVFGALFYYLIRFNERSWDKLIEVLSK